MLYQRLSPFYYENIREYIIFGVIELPYTKLSNEPNDSVFSTLLFYILNCGRYQVRYVPIYRGAPINKGALIYRDVRDRPDRAAYRQSDALGVHVRGVTGLKDVAAWIRDEAGGDVVVVVYYQRRSRKEIERLKTEIKEHDFPLNWFSPQYMHIFSRRNMYMSE